MTQRKRVSSGPVVGGLGAACAALLIAPSASALAPAVFTLAAGEGGEMAQNGGPGNEQPTVVTVTDAAGERYVVVIQMSSDVGAGLGPWQCKCTSLRLSPSGPPAIVADQVYLTQNQGSSRPCNHPMAATDGERIVWTFGYAENNGSTQTYAQAIDPSCQPLGDRALISDAASNAQQGAPDVRYVSGDRFVAGYYHDGNGDDHTYARGLALGPGGVLQADYRVAAVDDTSIGRPTIATYGEKALICAARGDERPPEDGVACAWINAVSGAVYWRDRIVAPSDPARDVYMNQPSLASLGGGRFALLVIESTGQGKDGGVKGASRVHLLVLEPSDADGPNAPGLRGEIEGIGEYQAHAALVAGRYGVEGRTFAGLFEAPITGSGVPLISFFSYDVAGQKWNPLDKVHDRWVVGAHPGDSGKLANLYGANPGKQGRDFLRGIGDVPNPGAGVAGGWMPEVKSFFVLPYAGKRDTDVKNALFVSFVPGETLGTPVEPEPPISNEDQTTGAASGGGPVKRVPAEVAGCSCGIAGRTGDPCGVVLALAALPALALRRRRARGGAGQ